MKTYHTSSSRETMDLGQELASQILATLTKDRHATVVAFEGELGAGKTTFVKGFFRGLGLKTKVTSPTFIIMRRTALRNTRFKNVYHVDAYRIRDTREMEVLAFREVLENPENIVLIEWAGQIRSLLPRNAKTIVFHHGASEHERIIIEKF